MKEVGFGSKFKATLATSSRGMWGRSQRYWRVAWEGCGDAK